MFERFSSGYYLGRLYVTPGESDTAAISREQHERVNEQLYATGEGVERLDRPLVMKVDERHFPVTGAEGVPEDTLAVPRSVLEDTRIDNPPALTEVLLAKADRAQQLLALSSDRTTAVDDPDEGPEPGGPAI
ncbi:DUF5802 family protein [Halorientalis halophila]|uniref:DUF5802 family protein n=1 Tax=Halorientalis halophila TaxID=3108499 RepID=UPI00300986E8